MEYNKGPVICYRCDVCNESIGFLQFEDYYDHDVCTECLKTFEFMSKEEIHEILKCEAVSQKIKMIKKMKKKHLGHEGVLPWIAKSKRYIAEDGYLFKIWGV